MIKILFDPKMENIINLTKDEAKTVKAISQEINEKSSRLYYPIQKLLDTGLITVSEEKQIGNLIEKYYSSRHLFDDNEMMKIEGDLAINNSDFIAARILLSINKGIDALKSDLDEEIQKEELNERSSSAMYTEINVNLNYSEWLKISEDIRDLINKRNNDNVVDTNEYTFSILTYKNK